MHERHYSVNRSVAFRGAPWPSVVLSLLALIRFLFHVFLFVFVV